MSSPNPVLVDHYIHHSSTTTIPACVDHQIMELQEKPTPLRMADLKRTDFASTAGRRQQKPKKQKTLHQHQPAPLAPRLIAPLQARPPCFVKNMETMMITPTTATSNNNTTTTTIVMPPMPTNPHEIAREAMRITQEAMKKQKLQELELQKQQQQQQQQHQQQSSSCSSSTMLLSPPPLLLPQSGGAFSSNKTGAANANNSTTLPTTTLMTSTTTTATGHVRLNKFVRRLHDMLRAEKNGGIVEWRRRGLLVLHNTHVFSKTILPKFFNTRNFKTFRRQLNYYGFVHVRSFSNDTTQPSTTTALWVHQELAASASAAQHQASSSSCCSSSMGSAAENQAHHAHDNNNNNRHENNNNNDDDDIAAVLQLRRVEACDAAAGAHPKTAEGRRHRKEQAIHTVEEDLGVNAKTLQMEHIQSLLVRGCSAAAAGAAAAAAASCGGGGGGGMNDVVVAPMTNATTTTLMTGGILPNNKAAAAGMTFAKALDEHTARFIKNATTNAAAAAAPTSSLQRVQSLLPAVPMEICVPRNGAAGNNSAAAFAAAAAAASSSLDQEATQGAANLLLLLSKAVSS